jgi:hypothetical protein
MGRAFIYLTKILIQLTWLVRLNKFTLLNYTGPLAQKRKAAGNDSFDLQLLHPIV